jgi:LAS superfamily LD-carboxypeptidase LdcB
MHLLKSAFLVITSVFFSCNNNSVGSNEAELNASIPAQETNKSIEIDSAFTLDYLRGHFDPVKHPDFIKVASAYTDGEQTYYLHKYTWEAFKDMADAAAKDSVKLIIRSATRNFDRQKLIWEGKWNGTRLIEEGVNASKKYADPKTRALKILLYSSMPGTSRHHWGTDLDLNNFNNSYFEKGEGAKIYNWLTENASAYGFCQPYSPKGEKRPHGYEEERWHWSYLPLAKQLTKLAEDSLSNEAIEGFKGAETAIEINVVKKYVLGVSDACL